MTKKKFENVEAAMAYQRELSDKLGVVENDLLNRELTDEERAAKTAERESLEVEYKAVEREAKMLLNEKQNRSLTSAPKVDVNTQLREFIKTAKKGDSFMLPLNREAMSTSDTTPYVQGITVVDLIDTERKDDDILLTAGVPMTTGVVGNKIQWAFAGGVEAVFAKIGRAHV